MARPSTVPQTPPLTQSPNCSMPPSPGPERDDRHVSQAPADATEFANRLRRNLRTIGRPMRRTGIFCATDEIAVGALGALTDLGVSVPSQVSVLGFDGLVDLYPGLASVAQDIPTIAHEAVTLALGAIERDTIRHTIVPVKIVEGATMGPAPRKG